MINTCVHVNILLVSFILVTYTSLYKFYTTFIMFTFGFSDNNETTDEANQETPEKHTLEKPEKTSPNWRKSEEIFIGNNEVSPELLIDENHYVLKMELDEKYVIRHVSADIVSEIIRKQKNIDDSIFKADQQHSDLIPAEYEGGLKIWQCTYDLLDYLLEQKIDFNGQKVLDLGCGAGILGLFAYVQGASVYFQDYNPEVLKYITIPNALLNNREDTEKPKECRFYSGDWQSFVEVTESDLDGDEKLFDCILTSETIYNCDNYVKLNDVFKKRLKKSGIIYLAAKTCYFGIGGSIRCFEDMIKADDVFDIGTVWRNKSGLQREIIALTFK